MDSKDEGKAFEISYDLESKEIIALTEDGTSTVGGERIAGLLAYVDTASGEIKEKKTMLCWPAAIKKCKLKRKRLKKESIYRLRVRESLPFTNQYTGKEMERGRWLMLEKVLKRNCHEERLEEILKQYKKPVTLHPEGCSEFLLDRPLGTFYGNGVWNGEACSISLKADGEQEKTAEDALTTLRELLNHCAEWDQRGRQFAASELTVTANEWLREDEAEITEASFAKRLMICEVGVSLNGDFDIYYDDDGMFWGHIIIVRGNIRDGFMDAEIAG